MSFLSKFSPVSNLYLFLSAVCWGVLWLTTLGEQLYYCPAKVRPVTAEFDDVSDGCQVTSTLNPDTLFRCVFLVAIALTSLKVLPVGSL